MRSSSNVPVQWKLYDEIQVNKRGLANLGVSAVSYAAMVSETLHKAVPGDIIVDYYKRESLESGAVLGMVSTQSPSEIEMVRLVSFL